MSITVYSKSGCPECTFTKKYLESENIAHEEKRVDLHDNYMEEVILLGYRTLPVVKINEEERVELNANYMEAVILLRYRTLPVVKINEEGTFTGYRLERLENLVLEWQR